jgi:hypothetical protein
MFPHENVSLMLKSSIDRIITVENMLFANVRRFLHAATEFDNEEKELPFYYLHKFDNFLYSEHIENVKRTYFDNLGNVKQWQL